ncbi:CFF_collapsed_G0031880.mRNA.1.CDS.1 [Saccharomyces cerevisiae]|nr:CFF_collapsed_G0031880.mRNA.1.CDS.1 [Saccharomyces cerevisiae]
MSEFKVKTGLAQMLKGGVIMDVVTPEQAIIAERAGACAVMALERIPADNAQVSAKYAVCQILA